MGKSEPDYRLFQNPERTGLFRRSRSPLSGALVAA
jgi:hypothetical protein